MHWVLDVNFREDDSRTRERTLGNNLSWLRRFAVTLLKRHPEKDSLRGKMIAGHTQPSRCAISSMSMAWPVAESREAARVDDALGKK